MTASEVTRSDHQRPWLDGTWKPIPGFSKYEASDLGHIRRAPVQGRHAAPTPGAVLKTRIGNSGYLLVKPYDDGGKQQTRTVHTLVLLAHHGPPPPGQETLHGKGGKMDNRLAEVAPEDHGIRYGTRRENIDEMMAAHPPKPKAAKVCVRCEEPFTGNGKRCHTCVVTIGEAAATLLRSGVTLAKAAEQLEYPSVEGVHALAVKYGGYGTEPPRLSQKVRTTVRRLFPGFSDGDAK